MRLKTSFKLKGASVIKKRLKNLRKQRKVLSRIGRQEVQNAQRRISSTKTDPEGRRWAPMSPATRKQRIKEGTIGKGLLNRTGALMNSIRHTIIGKTVKIETPVEYAKYLRRGTSNMPAREFLGWTKKTIAGVKRLVTRTITR